MFEKKINAKDKGMRFARDLSPGGRLLSAIKVVLIPAVFAGIIVMALYLSMQSSGEIESLKGPVLVAKADIAVNTFIKEGEASKYFEVASLDKGAIPGFAYKDLSELPKGDFYVRANMYKHQLIMKDAFTSNNQVMDKYSQGYEITSFAASSFDKSVNGALRKGDIVDVYAHDPATDVLTLMVENVYVSDVYDNSGNQIKEPDEVATSFTVWVTPEEVESINAAIVYGGIQMYLKEN